MPRANLQTTLADNTRRVNATWVQNDRAGVNSREEHAPLLLADHRLFLAERPEKDQPLNAGRDEHLHVRGRRVEIERAVLVELRGDGRKNTGPIRFHVWS